MIYYNIYIKRKTQIYNLFRVMRSVDVREV